MYAEAIKRLWHVRIPAISGGPAAWIVHRLRRPVGVAADKSQAPADKEAGFLSSRDQRLLAAVLITGIVALATNLIAVRNTERGLLEAETSATAIHWARFLQEHLSELDEILSDGLVSAQDQRVFDFASEAGRVIRYEVIRPDGVIALSSWAGDFRKSSINEHLAKVKATGKPLVILNEDSGFSDEVTVEGAAYVPMITKRGISGVIKVYVDMTERALALRKIGDRALLALSGLLAIFGALLCFFVWRNIRDRNRELEEVRRSRRRIEQAQNTIRALGQRNEMILNAAGEGIYGLDMEGRTTFINPAAARMIGWQPEELIGEPQHAILHHTKPDGSPYPKEACPIYAAFRDGTEHHVSDEVFWRQDGTSFPVEYTSTPIRNDSGELTGAVVVFKDITERKRAEEVLRKAHDELELRVEERTAELRDTNEALRESEAKLREILENSPVGVAVVTHAMDDTRVTGNRLFVNSAFVKMLGRASREDAIEAEISDSWVDLDQLRAVEEIMTNRGELVDFEALRRRMDGTELWVSMNSRRIRFDDQDCSMVWNFDITERKRAEDAQRRSEERFKDFAELASDWFWEMDEKLRFTHFSEEWTPGGRLNLSTLLGKTWKKWTAPNEDSELWRLHLDTLAARKPIRGLRYSRLDDHGAEIHIRVNGSPLFDADGIFLGYRGTASDVTAEVEAVALRASRDESQLANTAKSEFLANMSHELRTPLNAVVGFSDVMRKQMLGPIGNPKYLEYTKDIHDAGNHLLALINDILDLSKVESGKDELHEEVLEIGGLLDSVRKLVSGRAESASVGLKFDVARGLPALRADERKLKQIFVNLMSNAIKFTDTGGRVTFRAWNGDDGMVFQVVDTGIGIAAENIPIALAPFRQIEHGLVRKFHGTGLGLPLAKSLVEMHGGSLDLQSQVGVGTTVTVRFPAERIVQVSDHTAASARRRGAAG